LTGSHDAVIVATARTPIGRAYKGSLTTERADDLCVSAINAAVQQVPQLDPSTANDLIVGCGAPGGEQGFNMARVVAVLLGWDTVPGTTVTRYCASSLQGIRMAMHAIRAGEGHTFVVAGGGDGQPIAPRHQRQPTGARRHGSARPIRQPVGESQVCCGPGGHAVPCDGEDDATVVRSARAR